MKPKRRRCRSCREPFLATRSDAKTCGPKCRKRESRRRLSVTKKMSHMKARFTSATDLWSTPQDLFDRLNSRFGFTLDVCAVAENAKCERFYTPADDGLAQPWTGVCWLNPPYGRTIDQWLRKANEAVKQGATVVALVPVRTDTRWWHDYVTAHELEFLPGRLRFGSAKHHAPFASAVVVMRPSRLTWNAMWAQQFDYSRLARHEQNEQNEQMFADVRESSNEQNEHPP
jgi:phage N-6-adenine-methyltransferase